MNGSHSGSRWGRVVVGEVKKADEPGKFRGKVEARGQPSFPRPRAMGRGKREAKWKAESNGTLAPAMRREKHV